MSKTTKKQTKTKSKILRPTHKELILPNYLNNTTCIIVNGKLNGKKKQFKIPMHEAVIIPVLIGANTMYISDTGAGKTQVMKDITRHYFGGNVEIGGYTNWLLGRKDCHVEELFTEFNKDLMKYIVLEERISALVNVVDEMNRALGPTQADFFDLAEGERGIQGALRELGKHGYTLFLSGVNLNRVNGDFHVGDIDRALLSRSKINIDVDFYGNTKKDKAVVTSRGKAKTTNAELRDISEKIIFAYKEINDVAGEVDPFLDTYIGLLEIGLMYCEIDKHKRKRRMWPMKCQKCKLDDKVCSEIKQFEPRTTQTIKRFAIGIEYFLKLKHGEKVEIDPLDLVFEAAKFTAYHGNLSQRKLMHEYEGDDQDMMNTVLGKLKTEVKKIRQYIDEEIYDAMEGTQTKEKKCIQYKLNGQDIVIKRDKEIIAMLNERGITFQEFIPFSTLKKIGVDGEGVLEYLEGVIENYKGK